MADRIRTSRIATTLPWLAVVVWMGVIFGFSSLTGSEVPSRYGNLGHFGEYAILGALLVVAMRSRRGAALAIAVIVASLYGVTDEFHQSFVADRVPDVADWGLDTIGALAGAFVMTRIVLMRAARRRPS